MSETRDTQPDAITPERLEAAGFVRVGREYFEIEREEPWKRLDVTRLDLLDGKPWTLDGDAESGRPMVRLRPTTMAEVYQAAALIGIELSSTPAAPAAERPCAVCNRKAANMLGDEHCVGCEADQAKAELERCQAVITNACESEDEARKLAATVLPAAKVEGDGCGVPGIADLVEALVTQNATLEQQLAAARGERERLRAAAECFIKGSDIGRAASTDDSEPSIGRGIRLLRAALTDEPKATSNRKDRT